MTIRAFGQDSSQPTCKGPYRLAEVKQIEFLDLTVPLGVVTWTVPVVAPAGTVVVISEGERTVNAAAAPLKLTLVAPPEHAPVIKGKRLIL